MTTSVSYFRNMADDTAYDFSVYFLKKSARIEAKILSQILLS